MLLGLAVLLAACPARPPTDERSVPQAPDETGDDMDDDDMAY